MKKALALLLILAFAASVMCSCGTASPSSSDGESTSPTSVDVTSSSAASSDPSSGATAADDPFNGEDDISLIVWAPEKAVELTRSMCSDFIALYPEKTVSITVEASDEFDSAAAVIEAPDKAADVFGLPCDSLGRLCEAGLLAPVSDDRKADITDRNSVFSVSTATVGDVLCAYPETGENGYYLVYDKSVISDADAQTLEGIFAACRKAEKKFVMDASNGFYSCIFFYTGGMYNTGLGDDGSQIFSEYDEEKVVDSLEAFSQLIHEYSDVFMSAGTLTIFSGMSQKPSSVAAGVDGSWNGEADMAALGENYGAAKLPTINIKGADTQLYGMNGTKLLGVNARSKYPFAAQALADYLTGEVCQTERVEELGWLPSNMNALYSDAVRSSPMLAALRDQSEFSIPQTEVADSFWIPAGELGKAVCEGEDSSRSSLKEALQRMIAAINEQNMNKQ